MFERRDRLQRRLQRERFFSNLLYEAEASAKQTEVYPVMHDIVGKIARRDPSAVLHVGIPPTDLSGKTIVAELRFGVEPVMEIPGSNLWRSHGVRVVMEENSNPILYFLSGSSQTIPEIQHAVIDVAQRDGTDEDGQIDEMMRYALDFRKKSQGWLPAGSLIRPRQDIITAMARSNSTPGYFDFRKGESAANLSGRPSLDIISRRIQFAK